MLHAYGARDGAERHPSPCTLGVVSRSLSVALAITSLQEQITPQDKPLHALEFKAPLRSCKDVTPHGERVLTRSMSTFDSPFHRGITGCSHVWGAGVGGEGKRWELEGEKGLTRLNPAYPGLSIIALSPGTREACMFYL